MSYFRINYDSPASYDFVENNKLLYLLDHFLNNTNGHPDTFPIAMPLVDLIGILN